MTPKHSDLVINADVSSKFTLKGVAQLSSDAEVFSTPAMASLDVQRTWGAQGLACIRNVFDRAIGRKNVVSVKAMAGPGGIPGSHLYRLIMHNKTGKPVVMDTVFFARGRTEVAFFITMSTKAMAVVTKADTDFSLSLYNRVIA